MTEVADHSRIFHGPDGLTLLRDSEGNVRVEFRRYRTEHGQFEVLETATIAAEDWPRAVVAVGFDFGPGREDVIALTKRVHSGRES